MCDSDMYPYIFVLSDRQNGANMNPERPAALEAIRRKGGDLLMESQIVVDNADSGRHVPYGARRL
jgi:hypothetical protein